MKFYEIDEAIRGCIDEETGEVDIDCLEELQCERDKKLEGLALWCIEMSEDEKALKSQIERLTDKLHSVQNKRAQIKDFLALKLNGEKFKTSLVSVGYRKTTSVIIDDIDKLPSEFVTEVVDRKVDKNALKKAFGEWEYIEGAHIEIGQSVQIK